MTRRISFIGCADFKTLAEEVLKTATILQKEDVDLKTVTFDVSYHGPSVFSEQDWTTQSKIRQGHNLRICPNGMLEYLNLKEALVEKGATFHEIATQSNVPNPDDDSPCKITADEHACFTMPISEKDALRTDKLEDCYVYYGCQRLGEGPWVETFREALLRTTLKRVEKRSADPLYRNKGMEETLYTDEAAAQAASKKAALSVTKIETFTCCYQSRMHDPKIVFLSHFLSQNPDARQERTDWYVNDHVVNSKTLAENIALLTFAQENNLSNPKLQQVLLEKGVTKNVLTTLAAAIKDEILPIQMKGIQEIRAQSPAMFATLLKFAQTTNPNLAVKEHTYYALNPKKIAQFNAALKAAFIKFCEQGYMPSSETLFTSATQNTPVVFVTDPGSLYPAKLKVGVIAAQDADDEIALTMVLSAYTAHLDATKSPTPLLKIVVSDEGPYFERTITILSLLMKTFPEDSLDTILKNKVHVTLGAHVEKNHTAYNVPALKEDPESEGFIHPQMTDIANRSFQLFKENLLTFSSTEDGDLLELSEGQNEAARTAIEELNTLFFTLGQTLKAEALKAETSKAEASKAEASKAEARSAESMSQAQQLAIKTQASRAKALQAKTVLLSRAAAPPQGPTNGASRRRKSSECAFCCGARPRGVE